MAARSPTGRRALRRSSWGLEAYSGGSPWPAGFPGHPGMTPRWRVEVAFLRSGSEADDAEGNLPVVVRVRLRAPVRFLRGDGPRDEAQEPEQGSPAGRWAGAG